MTTASERGNLFDENCPTRHLLDRVGTKWTAMVIKLLSEANPDEVRFALLRRQMPGVSAKMLSQTLQGLVADGLVSRRVEPTTPPRVHYGVTALGLSLDGPLGAMREWAEAHMREVDDARGAHRHRPENSGADSDSNDLNAPAVSPRTAAPHVSSRTGRVTSLS